MHSHHDVAKLESTFGEDNLNDLSTWQDISSEAAGSVWIGKQGAYHRSLTHYRVSMFEQVACPALPWLAQDIAACNPS